MHLFGLDASQLIAAYGYWAVLLLVGLESMGLPVPGETALIAAAVYAGATPDLDILGVVAAAAIGAVMGDNLGYLAGRSLGLPLLARYGPLIGLGEERLLLGAYLFSRHGGKIVFFGRFVALLRALAALMAGASRMAWDRFFLFNLTGGLVWAALFGIGGYLLGSAVEHLAGPIGVALLAAAAVFAAIGWRYLRAHERRLLIAARQARVARLRR